MASMVRDWVAALPLREQGVLIVATRGCDSAPKFPLDSPERRLTAAIRYAVCVPHDEREVDAEKGCFMLSTPPADLKWGTLEHYPLHWVIHVLHACEAIAFRNPDPETADRWHDLYFRAVRALHLWPETPQDYGDRLSEDRIAGGNVVSV